MNSVHMLRMERCTHPSEDAASFETPGRAAGSMRIGGMGVCASSSCMVSGIRPCVDANLLRSLSVLCCVSFAGWCGLKALEKKMIKTTEKVGTVGNQCMGA